MFSGHRYPRVPGGGCLITRLEKAGPKENLVHFLGEKPAGVGCFF